MTPEIEKFVRLAEEGHGTPEAIEQRRELWESFTPDKQKQATESRVFVRFASTTKLVGDPYAHSNEDPPRPDICSLINGSPYHFELGELTDEGVARSISVSLKTGAVTGGALSQTAPLLKMIEQKCAKSYATNCSPVDLILYYWRTSPYEPALYGFLRSNLNEIEKLFRSSQFARIWIYEWNARKAMWKMEVSSIVP